MHRKKIIFIKTNLIDMDPRLMKEIDALSRHGYEITLLCWDRECKASRVQSWNTRDNYKEIRLRLKTSSGFKILPLVPIWWFYEFYWLMRSRWDIVHAINFDSIICAVIVARLKKKLIIYEIADVYIDMIVVPKLLRQIVIYIDKIFMRLANAVVIANEAQPKELNGIPNDLVVEIYNSPPDLLKKSLRISMDNSPIKITELFEGEVDIKKDGIFTLFFAGVLQRNRQANLDKVFQAVRDIYGVRVIVAGYGNQVKDIEKWASEAAGKVKYVGKINYSEVLEWTIASDLLFALYEPDVPTIRYAGGNKLFEAMMAGKPILVSKGTAMADLVERENCGVVLESNNVQEITRVITELKNDPDLCKRLGGNGRKAYEKKYSWEIMKQRLLNFYYEISQKANRG